VELPILVATHIHKSNLIYFEIRNINLHKIQMTQLAAEYHSLDTKRVGAAPKQFISAEHLQHIEENPRIKKRKVKEGIPVYTPADSIKPACMQAFRSQFYDLVFREVRHNTTKS
jgi:hypothetical protein